MIEKDLDYVVTAIFDQLSQDLLQIRPFIMVKVSMDMEDFSLDAIMSSLRYRLEQHFTGDLIGEENDT